ncbi:MAG: sodium:proton antiporter [Pirellulales bacterium]|nr:sodium:proton antiporter [Pirellulales bacterium]
MSTSTLVDSRGGNRNLPLLLAIAFLIGLYSLAVIFAWPVLSIGAHHEGGDHAHEHAPPIYSVAPFVVLLLAIAVLPLIPRTHHWWESNANRFRVAAVLATFTLGWYLIFRGTHGVTTVLQHALVAEYVPFIVLLFSLYTISGGIRIECDLKARPIVNTAFIAVGGALASFIGTTGAAMLLIRPLLDTNSERKYVTHTVVFFIFVVCNCGGLLLPIGDPPLFLGYLKGVDFFWTMKLLPQWLFVNGALLAVYYLWDRLFSYSKETKEDILRDETRVRPLRASGWLLNGTLLLGVVAAVALLDPSKPLPGTHWHPLPFMREVVMLTLVGASLYFGSSKIREQNRFNYGAIIEVAALFFGIFICMQPALEILKQNGAALGISTPTHFFWITGGLSSVLDNAPTYMVFFQTAQTLSEGASPATGGVAASLLAAISLGAVFMGAMTYIGNGPNFMVAAIANKSGVKMPSFFGYMLYSCAVLLPILAVASWLFL